MMILEVKENSQSQCINKAHIPQTSPYAVKHQHTMYTTK